MSARESAPHRDGRPERLPTTKSAPRAVLDRPCPLCPHVFECPFARQPRDECLELWPLGRPSRRELMVTSDQEAEWKKTALRVPWIRDVVGTWEQGGTDKRRGVPPTTGACSASLLRSGLCLAATWSRAEPVHRSTSAPSAKDRFPLHVPSAGDPGTSVCAVPQSRFRILRLRRRESPQVCRPVCLPTRLWSCRVRTS